MRICVAKGHYSNADTGEQQTNVNILLENPDVKKDCGNSSNKEKS